MFLRLVGLLSVCAKFHFPSLSRSGVKAPGGVVGWGWVECKAKLNKMWTYRSWKDVSTSKC